MGCSIRKPNFEEEQAMSELEEFLGFQKHSSETLDLHLRKYSSNNRLNQSQLIDLLNALNLISWDNRKQIMAFYDLFQAEPGKYLLKPLIVMMIMMGNSKPHIKAKLIFEAFDSDNTKKLSITLLYEIIDIMMKISLDNLPKLAEINFYSIELIKNYISALNSHRLIAKNKMIKLFVQTDLNSSDIILKDDFIFSCYKEEFASKVLTPQGVRSFIYTVSRGEKPVED